MQLLRPKFAGHTAAPADSSHPGNPNLPSSIHDQAIVAADPPRGGNRGSRARHCRRSPSSAQRATLQYSTSAQALPPRAPTPRLVPAPALNPQPPYQNDTAQPQPRTEIVEEDMVYELVAGGAATTGVLTGSARPEPKFRWAQGL